MGHPQLLWYAGLCGWTLARAHARSGDAIAIASYVGRSDTLDRSLAEFAELYADQNELDHQAFEQAIADGKIEAVDGV
jgi:NAD(P)H-dependent flavin oxidoreductase YrpB (nitropropane dioxygenase family)